MAGKRRVARRNRRIMRSFFATTLTTFPTIDTLEVQMINQPTA